MSVPPVRVPNGRMARLHYRLWNRLPQWVIYRPTTADYSGRWVARMHVTLPVHRATRFVITHDSLEELRATLPPGLYCIGRDPEDAPVIEEVWI